MAHKKNVMLVLLVALLLVAAVVAVVTITGNFTLLVDGMPPVTNGHCVGSSCTL